jgi:hypothetical protein
MKMAIAIKHAQKRVDKFNFECKVGQVVKNYILYMSPKIMNNNFNN